MKKILILVFFVLFVSFVSAEKILEMQILFEKSGKISVDSVRIIQGFSDKKNESGQFTVKLLDEEKNKVYENRIFVSFYSPGLFGELNEVMQTIKIPLRGKEKIVLIEFEEKQVFFEEIFVLVCNKNGICDEKETFLGCPDDCPLSEKDGFCLNQLDGICDPDCLKGVDSDCTEKFEEDLKDPEKKPESVNLIFLVLVLGGILILVFLFFYLRIQSKTKL